jgi:hypothetical protein
MGRETQRHRYTKAQRHRGEGELLPQQALHSFIDARFLDEARRHQVDDRLLGSSPLRLRVRESLWPAS